MSIFRTHSVACPACATPIDFELVVSVSADRRPDLRDEILAGTFQREPCPSCGVPFRVEPQFTYIDIARGQYIGVWPKADRAQWQERAAQTRANFDDGMGVRATPEAQRVGAGLAVRTVFGWPALVEKLLAREAGIDDRTLEVAKLAAMRGVEEAPLPGPFEMRLAAVDDEALHFAWIGSRPEAPEVWRVPRTLIAEIEAEPEAWQAAREAVAEGDVVDFQRELLAA
ncbi:MAG: CpXC domain-containing protein [Piscinibacter sp.]|nr:CpXC domain-containing protein [Piscinibacter sp.]